MICMYCIVCLYFQMMPLSYPIRNLPPRANTQRIFPALVSPRKAKRVQHFFLKLTQEAKWSLVFRHTLNKLRVAHLDIKSHKGFNRSDPALKG
ncbi:hypothetical protein FKM82_007783 [Ascaphus truei]